VAGCDGFKRAESVRAVDCEGTVIDHAALLLTLEQSLEGKTADAFAILNVQLCLAREDMSGPVFRWQGCRVFFSRKYGYEESRLSASADGHVGPRLPCGGWPAVVGRQFELELQQLLPGSRQPRLPDKQRRLQQHVLLRAQHKVLHVHGLLQVRREELLLQGTVLRELLVLAVLHLPLRHELLPVQQLRLLLLHLLWHLQQRRLTPFSWRPDCSSQFGEDRADACRNTHSGGRRPATSARTLCNSLVAYYGLGVSRVP
jgi:hypothetical protein